METCTAFEVLDYTLLSAPGAPLKQVLLDKGIGKDIMGSYEDGIYQPFFSIVAKNARPEDKERFVSLIQDTLKEIVKNGVDKKAIAAGINYMEFRFREADFSSFPKGLMYGIDVFDSWLYDDNRPFDQVMRLDIFEKLKAKADTGYFEELIEKYLIGEYPCFYCSGKIPKRGLAAETDKKLEGKTGGLQSSLSKEEISKIAADTRHLKKYQDEPETEEALRTIPLLKKKRYRHRSGKAIQYSKKRWEIPGFFTTTFILTASGIWICSLIQNRYLRI